MRCISATWCIVLGDVGEVSGGSMGPHDTGRRRHRLGLQATVEIPAEIKKWTTGKSERPASLSSPWGPSWGAPRTLDTIVIRDDRGTLAGPPSETPASRTGGRPPAVRGPHWAPWGLSNITEHYASRSTNASHFWMIPCSQFGNIYRRNVRRSERLRISDSGGLRWGHSMVCGGFGGAACNVDYRIEVLFFLIAIYCRL